MNPLYVHKSKARKQGIKSLGFGLILTGICGGILALIWSGGTISPGAVVFFVLFSVFGLIGLVFVVMSLIRIILGGHWHIEVSKEGVLWSSPRFSEAPFDYKIEEIDCLQKQVRQKTKSDGSIKTKIEYYLISHDGSKHWINKQSGLDVAAFNNALIAAGLELKEVIVKKKQKGITS